MGNDHACGGLAPVLGSRDSSLKEGSLDWTGDGLPECMRVAAEECFCLLWHDRSRFPRLAKPAQVHMEPRKRFIEMRVVRFDNFVACVQVCRKPCSDELFLLESHAAGSVAGLLLAGL